MGLLEKLLKDGSLVSDNQIKEARNAQKSKGGSLGEQLIRLGFITSGDYIEFFKKDTPYPMATYGMLRDVPPGVTNILSTDIVERYHIFPLGVMGKRLQVAFLDPTDDVALSEVCFATGMDVEPYCADPKELFQAINQSYELPTPEWVGMSKVPVKDKKLSEEKAEREEIEENMDLIAPKFEESAAKEDDEGFNFFESVKDAQLEDLKASVTKKHDETKVNQEEEKTEKIEKKIALVSPFPSPTSEVGETEPIIPGAMSEEFKAITPPEFRSSDKEKAPTEDKQKKENLINLKAPPEPEPLFSPEPTTGTFDALHDKMGEVATKEEVATEVLGWLKKQPVVRGAIFIVQKENAVGWRGFGSQLEGPSAARIRLSLEQANIFKTVIDTKEIYHGGILDSAENQEFVKLLQSRPQEIFLVPSILNGRVFAIIFAEVKPGRTITADKQLKPLAEALARGFVTLINKKKAA